MRACMAEGKKALFHCWQQIADVLEPSPMRNGHQGGTIRYTVGIVEYENGRVEEVAPNKIVFLDTQKLMQRFDKEVAKWEAKQNMAKTDPDLDDGHEAVFRQSNEVGAEQTEPDLTAGPQNNRSMKNSLKSLIGK